MGSPQSNEYTNMLILEYLLPFTFSNSQRLENQEVRQTPDQVTENENSWNPMKVDKAEFLFQSS